MELTHEQPEGALTGPAGDIAQPETGLADSPGLSGSVESGTLADVLLLLAMKPDVRGVLRVRTLIGEGEIWIDEGIAVSATFGAYQGRSAIHTLLNVTAGDFAFTDEPHMPAPTLNQPLAALLLDGGRADDQAEKREPPHALPSTPGPDAPAPDASPTSADPTAKEARQKDPNQKPAAWLGPISHLGAVLLLMMVITGEAVVLTRALQSASRDKAELQQALHDQTVEIRAAAIQKQVYAYVSEAHAFLADDDLASALTNFLKAVALSPADPSLQKLAASTRQRLVDDEETRRAAETGATARRQQTEANRRREKEVAQHIQAGDVSRNNGELEAALEHYRKALAIAPDTVGLPSLVDATEAQVIQKRQTDDSRHARLEAERQRREQIAEILARGDDARQRGDLETARQLYAELVAIDPDHADLPDRLALLDMHLKLRKGYAAEHWWSTDLAVASSGVAKFNLPQARDLDILVTATSGALRFGQMNDFGVAYDIYRELARPSPDGETTLVLDGRQYLIRWRRTPGGPAGRRYTYVIAVGLMPEATVAAPLGTNSGS